MLLIETILLLFAGMAYGGSFVGKYCLSSFLCVIVFKVAIARILNDKNRGLFDCTAFARAARIWLSCTISLFLFAMG